MNTNTNNTNNTNNNKTANGTQFGCFTIPSTIKYESDWRSEYQRMRDIPATVFLTGGRCFTDGTPSTSSSKIKIIHCKNGDLLYYARNTFWKEGYSMEPVPEGGFRRYPVDYKVAINLSQVKKQINGEPCTARMMIDKKQTQNGKTELVIKITDGGVWGWCPYHVEISEDDDIFEAIADAGWKSNWVVNCFMPWNKRKGRYEEFKEKFIRKVKSQINNDIIKI